MNKESEILNGIISYFHLNEDDITKKYVTDPLGDDYCLFTIN